MQHAVIRGLIAGTVTLAAGLTKIHTASTHIAANGTQIVQTSNNEVVLFVSGISGLTAIIVAVITIFGRAWLDKRDARHPKVHAASNEATDALVAELVRKEQTIERLKAHDRKHHDESE